MHKIIKPSLLHELLPTNAQTSENIYNVFDILRGKSNKFMEPSLNCAPVNCSRVMGQLVWLEPSLTDRSNSRAYHNYCCHKRLCFAPQLIRDWITIPTGLIWRRYNRHINYYSFSHEWKTTVHTCTIKHRINWIHKCKLVSKSQNTSDVKIPITA